MTRSWLLSLTLAALSLTRAAPARAGSDCGGSSGGGSSGWSFSASSSSSSSDGGSSACADETDIHGHRRCERFGGWAARRLPTVFFEWGAAMRSFASPLGEADGHVAHEQEWFTYRVAGRPAEQPSSPSETAVVGVLRLGFGLPRDLYVAGELELGGVLTPAHRTEMTSTGMLGAPSITPTTGVIAGANAVAGFQGDTALGAFGVELAGGRHGIAYQYESRYLSCVTTTSQAVGFSILEARARATFWLSPFVTFGVTAGASIIDRGDWMAAAQLGFVSRAYAHLRD